MGRPTIDIEHPVNCSHECASFACLLAVFLVSILGVELYPARWNPNICQPIANLDCALLCVKKEQMIPDTQSRRYTCSIVTQLLAISSCLQAVPPAFESHVGWSKNQLQNGGYVCDLLEVQDLGGTDLTPLSRALQEFGKMRDTCRDAPTRTLCVNALIKLCFVRSLREGGMPRTYPSSCPGGICHQLKTSQDSCMTANEA
jgi:hypothetical protein